MKIVFKKCVGIVVGVLVALQISGCVSSDEYYEDVGLSREAAFRQWKSRGQCKNEGASGWQRRQSRRDDESQRARPAGLHDRYESL